MYIPVHDYVHEFIHVRTCMLRQGTFMRHEPVVVNDGVEPVRDGDDGTVLELCPDGLLDEVVGVHVDRRRRLVEHEHLGVLNEGTCQAHQLLLTGAVDRYTYIVALLRRNVVDFRVFGIK